MLDILEYFLHKEVQFSLYLLEPESHLLLFTLLIIPFSQLLCIIKLLLVLLQRSTQVCWNRLNDSVHDNDLFSLLICSLLIVFSIGVALTGKIIDGLIGIWIGLIIQISSVN